MVSVRLHPENPSFSDQAPLLPDSKADGREIVVSNPRLPQQSSQPSQPTLRQTIVLALACYCLTSLVPVVGVMVGHHYFVPLRQAQAQEDDLLGAFANWDGQHY